MGERPKFGATIAGISMKSHTEARLLHSIIMDAMRDHAGSPYETLLAEWSNEIASIRRRAQRDNWIGWEEP